MWEIPVYAAEKKDGIDQLVRANASIAYLSPTRAISEIRHAGLKEKFSKSTASANKDQFDLFYLDTILVTTGWNKNDDIFLKAPTWASRHTAEDKPFNFGHNQLDIIGHITSNYAVDDTYAAIDNDSTLDDVPDKFHILTEAVIYKAWSDKTQAERIQKIIAEISEDKWFVSMECLFRGFDYGVTAENGDMRVIARTEESAFLTKHLRAYKGTGKYQDYKIGRVLSNFSFSGKGLVENPANPESIIFNNVATFKSTFANLGYINSSGSNLSTSQEITMAENDKDLQKVIDRVEAEKAALAKKLEEVSAQAAKASEDKVNSLTTAVEDEKKKKKEAEDKADAAAKEKDAMKAELDKKKKEVEDTKAEVDSLKKTVDEFKKASKVKAKASHLTEAEVDTFMADWADATETQFDKALDLLTKNVADTGSLAPSITAPKKGGLKPGDDSGAQRVNNGGGAKTGGNTVAAADSVVDDAETPPVTAAAAANLNEVETARAALGTFLESKMKLTKSRKR